MISIAAAMLACPNLAMPAQLMYHVAEVESNLNQFAIGVVGGRLLRQPASLDEAVATAQMLQSKGYNFSLGVAQVNRTNLKKYGLDTYAKAFDICVNLSAGSKILAQCYVNAHRDWGKAFSCYYSGDYTTGFRDGYVQKVFAAFNRGFDVARNATATGLAIPLATGGTHSNAAAHTLTPVPGSAAYRIAIRSMALDTATESVVVPLVKQLTGQGADAITAVPTMSAQPAPATAAPALAAVAAGSAARAIFRPQVTGPNDPPVATAIGDTTALTATSHADVDQSDARDGAFVF